MLFIILAFIILINCSYRFFFDDDPYTMSENYVSYLRKELASLDPNRASDQSMYVELKTELDTYELAKQYETGSWQQTIVNQEIRAYIQEMNTYQYGIEKDEAKLEEVKSKYNALVEKLNEDNWKYFVETELEMQKEELAELKNRKEETEDKAVLSEIENNMKRKEVQIEVLNMRLEKNISYAEGYLNNAINRYLNSKEGILEYESSKNPTYEEKQEYYQALSRGALSKYAIEHNQDINKQDDLRGTLMGIFEEYELFIIVFIIMIAGVIVSEEFSKGTIKLLLVRPYGRMKILLSKYITCLIMILFAIAVVVLMQLLVGGILFGFDSLSVPAVVYDFNQNAVTSMNVFSYLAIQAVSKLPLYILLITIAFVLSTVFTNSAVAITIALLGYMSTSIINTLVIEYKIGFMKYFITMNWDMSQYLFGGLPNAEGMTAGFSIAVCLAYFVILMIPTFIIFKKKNIKNI